MALDPIKGGIFMLAMLGFTRSLYKKLEEYAVKKDAKKIFDARKALYTEVPAHRRLGEGELVAERAALDPTERELAGFARVADYVDVYDPKSSFADASKTPYRVLRTEDGVVVALIFWPPAATHPRVHLVTELTDGTFVLTKTNDEPTIAELVTRHRKDVAAARAKEGVEVVPIDSFESYVASHERRWDAIRADRKKNGWVKPGEIAFPSRVKPDARKRIYEEIAKITAFDARRS